MNNLGGVSVSDKIPFLERLLKGLTKIINEIYNHQTQDGTIITLFPLSLLHVNLHSAEWGFFFSTKKKKKTSFKQMLNKLYTVYIIIYIIIEINDPYIIK